MRAESEATFEQRTQIAARLIAALRFDAGRQGGKKAERQGDTETRGQGEEDEDKTASAPGSVPLSPCPIVPLSPSSQSPPRQRFILFAGPLVLAILDGRKTVTRRPVAGNRQPTGPCPFGVAGDELWVREKWGYRDEFYSRSARGTGGFVYAADGTPADARHLAWRPSLHMPRAACRLELRVTDSRAERLCEMTEANALAEGCPATHRRDPLVWFRETWDAYYGGSGIGWFVNPWVWVVSFEVVSRKV